ncbi:hypothetical protein [Vibrio parahaemolyticus]|uniref:hypothetical protein n=1 Tax=Vibrio parahaemolyticus TaxID=670 RepID=UPI00046EA36E|nr:hypothetical protein [Vibrio parahaemolyticus]
MNHQLASILKQVRALPEDQLYRLANGLAAKSEHDKTAHSTLVFLIKNEPRLAKIKRSYQKRHEARIATHHAKKSISKRNKKLSKKNRFSDGYASINTSLIGVTSARNWKHAK